MPEFTVAVIDAKTIIKPIQKIQVDIIKELLGKYDWETASWKVYNVLDYVP